MNPHLTILGFAVGGLGAYSFIMAVITGCNRPTRPGILMMAVSLPILLAGILL